MNFTDVDDKIILRAKEENIPWREVTAKYEKIFRDDMQSLNVKLPTIIPRATEYIADMISMISTLLDKGYAYKTSDGVYMSVEKVKDYGQLLAEGALKDLESRLAKENTGEKNDKTDPRDFAIWKFYVPEDGDVVFETPFGSGRPGWHIECSAMAMKTLGETFDLHAGGADLLFPHHTNEIAQSQSATGKIPAHYWIYFAFVNVTGDKMSKSKQNFYTLLDLHKEFVSPLAYRYWLLQAHYRTPVDFSFESVKAAQQGLLRLVNIFLELNSRVKTANQEGHQETSSGELDKYFTNFKSCLENDFDMPGALATVWKILKDSKITAGEKLHFLKKTDEVLGLDLEGVQKQVNQMLEREFNQPLPPEIQALAELRDLARKEKDWPKADALRKEIESRGFTVKDLADKQEIRKA
jgi:cysteinyl-tRNA synthetase